PLAGVEYWSLAGVVPTRPAATAAEVFSRSLVRAQACSRQASVARVTAREVPLALDLAPNRPAPRISWNAPARIAQRTAPRSPWTRAETEPSFKVVGVSAAPATEPRTGR